MEFKLEDFTANPTRAALERCKKADLIAVANSFGVQMPVSVKKSGLKELVLEELDQRGLSKSAGFVEARYRQLEVEATHLRVKALELERGAAVAVSSAVPSTTPPSPVTALT